MMVRDLEVRKDVKGGNPKTPPGGLRPTYGYQDPPTPTPLPITIPPPNGNGYGVWKLAACTAITACLGLVGMYCTAMTTRGVTNKDVQDYVEKFSPYSHDKELIALQQQNQDKEIGSLQALAQRTFERMNKFEEMKITVDRDLQEHDSKIKMLTNYIEAEKFPKK